MTNGMSYLGKMARDKVTGFTGVITAWAKHLYGCDTFVLTPKIGKDGTRKDGEWFDEGRIEVLSKGHIKPETVASPSGKNGGAVLPPLK